MTSDEKQALIAALGQAINDEVARAMAEYSAQLTRLESKIENAELRVREYRWAGVWSEKSRYKKGNMVTHGGSTWYCNIDTETMPGRDYEAWTLVAKRGNDAPGARV